MRTDLYTKAMLTVIAACLVWLCLGGPTLLPRVSAQDEYERVVLVGWTEFTEAQGRVQNIGSHPLPVKER